MKKIKENEFNVFNLYGDEDDINQNKQQKPLMEKF